MKIKVLSFCLIFSMIFIISGCNNAYDIDDLYQVTSETDFSYNYTVKDKNGNVLLFEENLHREPHIDIVNDRVLKVSLQTGTGLSTRWTIYCDVDSGNISETYYYVLGEYENKVIMVTFENPTHKIIVRDIFDKDIFYEETILSDVFVAPDPVVDFEITKNGMAKITYLKDPDLIETEITVNLNDV